MIEKSTVLFTPTKLRIVLFVLMILTVILGGVGFWLFNETLNGLVRDVQANTASANASSNDVATLSRLKTTLANDIVAINRAKSIVADSKAYKYQDQIISDLNKYAANSKIVIEGYTFGASGAAPAAAPTPTTPTTPTSPAPAGGVKTTTVSFTVKNPVDYTAIMRFIYSIEQNLTKMQLTGISLTKKPDQPKNTVDVGPFNVEVYIQ